MHFLLNELSIEGQFNDKYEIDPCMDSIRAIIQELKVLRNFRLSTHQSLSERRLCNEYRVLDWLRDYSKRQDKDKDFLLLIIRLLEGTCISKTLDEAFKDGLYYWECYFNDENIFSSSLAGAAYFEGRLVSVQNSKNFNIPLVTVQFSRNDEVHEVVNIENIFELDHAQRLRPKFYYHPKHDLWGHWDDATPMDLDDDEAQAALDQSLLHEGHTQRYSYYKRKFYVFQNDNAGGYHGYPIDESKVPSSLLKELKTS